MFERRPRIFRQNSYEDSFNELQTAICQAQSEQEARKPAEAEAERAAMIEAERAGDPEDSKGAEDAQG